jgi:hypothetical protein
VGEEIVFRLFLFPLPAWLLGLLWHTPEGLPITSAFWVSLTMAALLFAATHVPIVEDLEGYTISSVLRAMLVLFPPGLMLGACIAATDLKPQSSPTPVDSGLAGSIQPCTEQRKSGVQREQTLNPLSFALSSTGVVEMCQ